MKFNNFQISLLIGTEYWG